MVIGLWGHACFSCQCQTERNENRADVICNIFTFSHTEIDSVITAVSKQLSHCRRSWNIFFFQTNPGEQYSHRLDSLPFFLPDVFSVDQSEEAEVDHVPRGAVFISHQIQSHGDMRVTVVTAEVVLRREQRVQIRPGVFVFVE